MATFSYIASGSKGETVRGKIPASSKNEVAQLLKQKGLFLVSCKPEDDGVAGLPAAQDNNRQALPSGRRGTPPLRLQTAGAAQSSASIPLNSSSASTAAHSGTSWLSGLFQPKKLDPNVDPGGNIPLKELVILTRQISISINAGMSFVEALQSLAANTRNPRMAWVLRQILEGILSGKKFSDALADHPDVFKPVYISMAAAGEAGGFMPEALNRTSEFLEKEIELRAKIKSAMVYPMVIACVATVVVTGMMAFIVPTFVKVFQDMNAPLPLPTRILIMASNFVRHGGFMAPVGVVLLLFYMGKLRQKNERFRAIWDEKVLGMPLFGKLITLGIITRFIRTLSSLVANGVMALQALSVSRQVVENRTIEKVVDDIFASVQQGNGISPVLYKSKYFPVLVANMVATGEKTGAIPEVLSKMADYYDSEVAAAIRDLLTLMEPLLIVVMAVIVGFIIAGLMLPTFQMSSLVG